jgi:putative ABC transport system ATP-binding protein
MVDISKVYKMGDIEVPALRAVNLEMEEGEFVAIMGPSGSGKSTLMNLIGCLDTPTQGKYWLDSREVSLLSDDELADIRNMKIGFVFQGFNLLPRLTALENVELPLIYRGVGSRERREKAMEALARVGLENRMNHKPSELSGGQQQRVAIARALAGNPPLILADEPTGNLDSASGKEVLATLGELNRQGHSIVLITHDPDIAAQAARIVRIQDGIIVSDERRT